MPVSAVFPAVDPFIISPPIRVACARLAVVDGILGAVAAAAATTAVSVRKDGARQPAWLA